MHAYTVVGDLSRPFRPGSIAAWRNGRWSRPPAAMGAVMEEHRLWSVAAQGVATTVKVDSAHGVGVVRLNGPTREPIPKDLATLVRQSRGSTGQVIIDLGDDPLLDRDSLIVLITAIDQADGIEELSVVCERRTGRLLLFRWELARCVAIFGTVADALQASWHAEESCGPGWSPTQFGPIRRCTIADTGAASRVAAPTALPGPSSCGV